MSFCSRLKKFCGVDYPKTIQLQNLTDHIKALFFKCLELEGDGK